VSATLPLELTVAASVPSNGRAAGGGVPVAVSEGVDAVPDEHYFTLIEQGEHHGALRKIATFDLVANNADRKSGHCLLDHDGHLWAIDNGLCFHPQPKLRTVMWDFAGERIDEQLLAGLEPLSAGRLPAALDHLLEEDELAAICSRAAATLKRGRYPEPSGDFPYPWPLV